MVIFKDKNWQTLSGYPDVNFISELDCFIQEQKDNILCVIPETTAPELAEKVRQLTPDFDVIFDDSGNVVDIIATEEASQ